MRQAANDLFVPLTIALEGCVPHMYLDILGLVTIGLGCLIDPVDLALPLPFVYRADKTSRATRAEILAEWRKIKGRPGLRNLHFNYAGALCTLKLSPEGIKTLALGRVDSNERHLRAHFPDWDDWPANAQLATMSMAWAMGVGFIEKFPSWTKAAKKADWATCAKECLMRTTGNPGLIPRNKANVAMFKAAKTEGEDEILVQKIRDCHPYTFGNLGSDG